MIKLNTYDIITLHSMMAAETGGSTGIRDVGLLESAIESSYATFDKNELYKTAEEKAAKMCFSLISNHAFVDGNKRIGIYVMLVFLKINGIEINCTDNELVTIGLDLASNKMNYIQLLNWIKNHIDS